ncbi:MAG: endolytic transglycosylase MltG [Nitrospirae bacterium]|nr:endolytic transglycosylase MltG [Nitrospirota bacterium]
MKKNIIIILLSIILLYTAYAAFEMLMPVQTAGKNVEIQIPRGATFRQAAEILSKEKLIRDKKVFMVLGRLTGADRKIRAGFYSVWTSMTPLEIFKIIRLGRIIEYEIKVLEGDSLLEISEAFSKTGIIPPDEFMELSRDREFLSSHNISSPSLEGYIFPDTYTVPKGLKAEEALGQMITRMREKISPEFSKKAEKLGMTEAEVLTLASIIEKEAVVDSERPLISAVYHNRLRKKMPLQADPTSIYGIKSSKEKIMRSDLQRKTPYNTYIIQGLPPGPIASPGLKSVLAALEPAPVPYLYFVSNNDGTHVFSVSHSEHAEAVRAYREKKSKS